MRNMDEIKTGNMKVNAMITALISDFRKIPIGEIVSRLDTIQKKTNELIEERTSAVAAENDMPQAAITSKHTERKGVENMMNLKQVTEQIIKNDVLIMELEADIQTLPVSEVMSRLAEIRKASNTATDALIALMGYQDDSTNDGK